MNRWNAAASLGRQCYKHLLDGSNKGVRRKVWETSTGNNYSFSRNISRSLSTANNMTSSSSAKEGDSNEAKMEHYKKIIYKLSLGKVHEMGWTDEAIASAVNDADLPLTLSGLIFAETDESHSTSSSALNVALIHRFMEECNSKLRNILQEKKVNIPENPNENDKIKIMTDIIPERLNFALRTRLEMQAQYVRSKRWHEAMAIGSLPQNSYQTAQRLEELVDIIYNDLTTSFGSDLIQEFAYCYGTLHKTAIGSVYVATELHMVADVNDNSTSSACDFADTWDFLNTRVSELQSIANVINTSNGNSDMVVAFSAIVSSMGSAVLSLGQPLVKSAVTAASGSILPAFMALMQKPDQTMSVSGSRITDYDLQGKEKYASNLNSISTSSTQIRRFSSTSEGGISQEVETIINDNDVVVFSKSYCPYCLSTKSLFERIGVVIKVIELDEINDGDAIQSHLHKSTGQRTVPNVFIKGNHLGGNDKTQAAYASGQLEEMMK